MVENNITLF